jgi:hypothetical protein
VSEPQIKTPKKKPKNGELMEEEKRHLQNIIITKNCYNLINFQTEGDRL